MEMGNPRVSTNNMPLAPLGVLVDIKATDEC